MPLVNDGCYRGRHACHVQPHLKLGKHLTLIHAAFDLVCDLLERDEVGLVDLGKLVHAGGLSFEHSCRINAKHKRLFLVLSTTAAAQAIEVKITDVEHVGEVSSLIEAQWEKESLVSERERAKQFDT